MDGMGSLSARRLNQAEDLSGPLIPPVAPVVDPVLSLDLQVPLMRLGDVFG